MNIILTDWCSIKETKQGRSAAANKATILKVSGFLVPVLLKWEKWNNVVKKVNKLWLYFFAFVANKSGKSVLQEIST